MFSKDFGSPQPLRGDKSDEDSNFIQLLKIDIEEDVKFSDWIDKKANKYVFHDIQNKLLKTMALSFLRQRRSKCAPSKPVRVLPVNCSA